MIFLDNNYYIKNVDTVETTVVYAEYGILIKNIAPILDENQLSDLVNGKISNLIAKELKL